MEIEGEGEGEGEFLGHGDRVVCVGHRRRVA